MKYILFLFILVSCNSSEEEVVPVLLQKTSHGNIDSSKTIDRPEYTFDKKKEEEGCEDEEELKKKLLEKKEFKLQNDEPGCEVK